MGEPSVRWISFVWLTGLDGVSIGLLAGIGSSQVKLGLVPQEFKMSPIAGFFRAIPTYWAPIFVTFLFGLDLYTTLPDAALPKSKQNDDSNGAGFMQSLVTLFNADGCVWLIVRVVARKVESSKNGVSVDGAIDTGK